MKRAIAVIIITVSLLTLAITEVILVEKVISTLEADVSQLYDDILENKPDVDVLEPQVKDIKDRWNKDESRLCIMFNHKDLSIITDTLTRLYSCIQQNNFDDAFIEVSLLKESTVKNRDVMSFSIQNLL